MAVPQYGQNQGEQCPHRGAYAVMEDGVLYHTCRVHRDPRFKKQKTVTHTNLASVVEGWKDIHYSNLKHHQLGWKTASVY
jgi:hypothetical protein